MKISIFYVGKKIGDYTDKLEEYKNRISKFSDFEFIRFDHASNGNDEEKAKIESLKILSKIDKGDFVVLLDEKGSELDSIGLADFIDMKMNDSIKKVIFIIGGAYGVNDEVKDRANYILRISKMVWPHELLRLMLTEQIYRSFAILSNLPYHHE